MDIKLVVIQVQSKHTLPRIAHLRGSQFNSTSKNALVRCFRSNNKRNHLLCIGSNSMPWYGLLTNPSNDIVHEISKIYDLNFEYAEIGIEGLKVI
ncbi:MAG: hypothetical protein ACJ72R_05865 [Nitrososphaeraceae archaeon]